MQLFYDSIKLTAPNHARGNGIILVCCVAFISFSLCQAQAPPGYTITTIAGNGTAGFSGDGGAATSAQVSGAFSIAIDGSGNIYIADQFNHRIRKVTGGTISTVAGTGTSGYSGDGAAATAAKLNAPQGVALDSAGNLYIADTANFVIRKVTTSGTISTIAGTNSTGSG